MKALNILVTTATKAQTGKIEHLSGSTKKISQLVGDYDRHQQIQTLNLTDSRYGLQSTDLGVPFRHNGRTYLLCGDSWGGRLWAMFMPTQPTPIRKTAFILHL